MQIRAQKDFTVENFNIRTLWGRKSTRPRKVKAGEVFEVKRSGPCTALSAFHGATVYAVQDTKRDRTLFISEYDPVEVL